MKYAGNGYFQANTLNSEMMGLDSKIPRAIELPLRIPPSASSFQNSLA